MNDCGECQNCGYLEGRHRMSDGACPGGEFNSDGTALGWWRQTTYLHPAEPVVLEKGMVQL